MELIIENGLRNACEATVGVRADGLVIVSWGETDRETWVTAVDEGPGLPPRRDLFQIAVTTKDGHLGMGLAISQRAALSMGGGLTLASRTGGGAFYEFRWPRPS